MRTIKFRVWDKHKKYMHKLDALFLDEKMFRVQNYKNEHDVFSFGTEYFSEPMQFTGLLDKNGIEIYEGDIVKVSSYLVNGLGKVGFNRGSFVFNKFDYPTSQVLHSFSEIEVIGNIYENPELLESK